MNVKTALPKFAVAALLCLTGCAETAIEDEPTGSYDATVPWDAAGEDAAATEDAGWDPSDGSLSSDAGVELDASSGLDAAAPDGGRDGGASDASIADASKPDGSQPDASAPKDAAVDAAPAQDASTKPDSGSGGKCDPKTCTNDCGASGVLRCCIDDNTCGCTWFPVYCS